MKIRTTFMGNESPLLEVISQYSHLQVIVCEAAFGVKRRYFGSAHAFAKTHGIQIVSPPEYTKGTTRPETDLIIVSGYPNLIKSDVIRFPHIGIINIHQSLLPLYRGRHPLNWAIINGEKFTGVTVHHVNEILDDGNIISLKKVPIKAEETVMDIYNKTILAAKKLVVEVIGAVGSDAFKGYRQDASKASYYPPRKPTDGRVDWTKSAVEIKNLVRGLVYPYPGAYFYFNRKKIILEQVEALENERAPGNVGRPYKKGKNVFIGTGKGVIQVLKTRGVNII